MEYSFEEQMHNGYPSYHASTVDCSDVEPLQVVRMAKDRIGITSKAWRSADHMGTSTELNIILTDGEAADLATQIINGLFERISEEEING